MVENLNACSKEDLIKIIDDLKEDSSKTKKDLRRQVRKLEKDNFLIDLDKQKAENKINFLHSEISSFKKTPLILANVIEVFDDGRVAIKGAVGHNFLVSCPNSIDKSLLKPGVRVALNQHTLAVSEVFPAEKDAEVSAMEIETKPDITYSEIGGLSNQIREIKEAVELPLNEPELFEEVGIDPPKGILLSGPPGTGKTLLARAVANETNATFIKLGASEFVNKFIGEGARTVREVFDLAKQKTPSIIFIDELDAIGTKRINSSTGGDREVQRTLMQLLVELDGFDSRGDVGIIGATNRPDILDPALLRPGRFDRIIDVPLPNVEARIDILKIHTGRMSLDDSVSFENLAILSENMSGADLKAVCTEAGMFTIREKRKKVTFNDFENAINKVFASSQ